MTHTGHFKRRLVLFGLDHSSRDAYESGLVPQILKDRHEFAKDINSVVQDTEFGNIVMANHKSAKKRARQTIKRNETNRSRRASIRTLAKEAEVAAATGTPAVALAALRKAESALAKGAARGTLHWKTAARKASRLAKRAKVAKKA